MLEVDAQNPDLSIFAGARRYKSLGTVTAVRLTQPVAVRDLLGVTRADAGDYLVRDRTTGCASIVRRAIFESAYFTERELDGARRAKAPRAITIQ